MKLYICSITELSDAASYDAASLKIDSLRKEKLNKIKNKDDRKRSLCAGLLLNYAVALFRLGKSEETESEEIRLDEKLRYNMPEAEELSLNTLLEIPGQEFDYRQDGNGKPYLADVPEFHFSLSHSGDYVACACGSTEIGVDLQCMDREVKETLAKKVMTQVEYERYVSLPECERKAEFYRIWTLKESCCKLTGKGLSQNFLDMEIEYAEQQIFLQGEERKIYFAAIPWKENYRLAVSRFE